MYRTRKIICLLLLVACTSGCNVLEFPFFVLFGQTGTKVKAEYTELRDTRTAMIVVTDSATDFEFPYARTDLALLGADRISKNVKGVQFVAHEKINAFQQNDLDWFTLSMEQIGEKFSAQRVLWLDVVRFTMLEDNSISLLRGRIIVDVRVYDMQSPTPNIPSYKSEVSIIVPEHAPIPTDDVAYQRIVQKAMIDCAEQLARKFYDHRLENN